METSGIILQPPVGLFPYIHCRDSRICGLWRYTVVWLKNREPVLSCCWNQTVVSLCRMLAFCSHMQRSFSHFRVSALALTIDARVFHIACTGRNHSVAMVSCSGSFYRMNLKWTKKTSDPDLKKQTAGRQWRHVRLSFVSVMILLRTAVGSETTKHLRRRLYIYQVAYLNIISQERGKKKTSLDEKRWLEIERSNSSLWKRKAKTVAHTPPWKTCKGWGWKRARGEMERGRESGDVAGRQWREGKIVSFQKWRVSQE